MTEGAGLAGYRLASFVALTSVQFGVEEGSISGRKQ